MPGIFQSLEIARRALWASRLGLDVTSHNIANVNTPGYSRQRVDLQTPLPLNYPKWQLGLGVDANAITRIRNQMLDYQYRQANFSLGRSQVQEETFRQLEAIIQEPADNSLGNLITEFFSEFSNLAAEPDNMTIRDVIVQKAAVLVEAFHTKYNNLQQLQYSLRQQAASLLKQVNELTSQLADLNAQIATAQAAGSFPNDLKDRRDHILDQLSQFMDIRYSEDAVGRVTVTTGGITLVNGNHSRSLALRVDKNNQLFTMHIVSENGREVTITQGKLGGYLRSHNQDIADLLNDLNELASHFIEEVNRLHRNGKGLPVGNPPQSQSGLDFFTGNDALTIDIHQKIRENVANIAASLDGSEGNGEVAIAIANLRNKKMFKGRTQTLNEFYQNVVGSLATQIQQVQDSRQNQELLLEQIENQRQSVAGVSLDEEMTNLIKYQKALEASSKVVRVVDEVLDTIIQMK